MASSISSGSGSQTATPAYVPPVTSAEIPFWDEEGADSYVQLFEVPLWNQCELGGHKLPGICVVEVPGRKRKVDVKDAPGQGLANLTVKGYSPSKVTITITIWTPEQWRQWRQVRPLLERPAEKGKQEAVPISNPVTDDVGISAMVIECISGLKNGPQFGTKQIVIEGTEQGKTTATGSGTAKGGGGEDLIKKGYFAAYTAYVTSIRANSGGGGYWLTWAAWITQQGAPQYAKPNPAGYAAWAPPGMP